jgi:hypothetical protein
MLPNLVVIGARKAGTTSLYHYLRAHPDIGMPREKELDFFVAERNWRRGREWYERLFPDDTSVRGEASPFYTSLPRYRGVPERMAALLPDARIIYLVRDPVERLLSHYTMDIWMGRERRSLAEVVRDEQGQFVVESRYWMQLEPYLTRFPADQILVLDAAALLHRRANTLRRVFAFLEVDESFTSECFADIHMSRPAHRRRRGAAGAVETLNRTLGKATTFDLIKRAPAPLRRVLTSELKPAVLEAGQRRRLEALFAEDARRLRGFTGLELATWSV